MAFPNRICYIVEHISRGTYMGMKDGKPRCSYSGLRSECHIFNDLERAREVQKLIPKSYILKWDPNCPAHRRMLEVVK